MQRSYVKIDNRHVCYSVVYTIPNLTAKLLNIFKSIYISDMAADRKNLRSATPKILLGSSSYEIVEHFMGNQVPTGKEVVGRMMYLTSKEMRNIVQHSIDSAALEVVKELQDIFIYMLNIYPQKEQNIKNRVISDYQEFKKLANYPKAKRSGESFQANVKKLNQKLERGYDIKTEDKERQEQLAEYHGVKTGPEEEMLYQDNVKAKECLCDSSFVTKCVACPRQMFAQSSVDKDWLKEVIKKKEDLEKAKKSKEKSDKSIESLFSKVDSGSESLGLPTDDSGNIPDDMHNDEVFSSPLPIPVNMFASPSVSTRSRPGTPSSSSSSSSTSIPPAAKFPKIPVRFGRKTLNPKVMVAAVHVASKYDISLSSTVKVIVDVMNMICDQEWTYEADFEESTEEIDEGDHDHVVVDVENPAKKPRKMQQDLTFRIPCRQTIAAWLRDAAVLSLKFLGDALINKEDGAIVTLGTDDTIKKAGHRVFDSKTNHITIKGPNTDKVTFTTGFDPNLSHKGSDSAFSIETKLNMLAVLTSSTMEEIKSQVNFWMGDRADDVTKAFAILGIESGRVLRCSAHITLGADSAVDKVFKLFENTIGVQNLISLNAGQASFINNNSVFTMAINALSKLFSYSHATLPYSLCVMYKKWRKAEGLEKIDFEDFSSNRFGRIAVLAKRFLQNREDFIKFFEQCVDEHANKLGKILN